MTYAIFRSLGPYWGITTIKRTHNSLRIRTYRSVDSRELKTVWNQHLQKNRGEGGLIVNEIPDEGICPEEHRDEGSLFTSDEDAYPERVRRGGRVEGPLFAPDEGICPEEHRARLPVSDRHPRQATTNSTDPYPPARQSE